MDVWQFFDNTKKLLAFIAAEYGNDALFSRKNFSDHISPLMPLAQKNILKQVFECGAVKILQDNMVSDQSRKETAVKQAAGKMIDAYATSNDVAMRIIWEFTNAIGWSIQEPQQHETSGSLSSSSMSFLIDKGINNLANAEWDEAAEKFEEVLNLDSKNAQAYIGKLCAKLRMRKPEELAQSKKPLTEYKNFNKAIKFANPAFRLELEKYKKAVSDKINEKKKQEIKQKARKQSNVLKDTEHLLNEIDEFDDSILDSFNKTASASPVMQANRQNTTIGNIVSFGKYLWLVLDVKGNEALLLTKEIVETKEYHHERGGTTWEECSLRSYLNHDFLNCFKADEKSKIVNAYLVNNDNPWYGMKGGNDTNDKVFLLSVEEVLKYFGDSGQLGDLDAEDRGFIDDQFNTKRIAQYNGTEFRWFLRTPGYNGINKSLNSHAAYVGDSGRLSICGYGKTFDLGIRPAIWLRL